THLATFAKQFRPETSAKLLAAWCHTLKHAGGTVMIRVLERLDRKKMTEEVRAGHEDLLGYLRKNEGRMDYPTYLRNGWQIATASASGDVNDAVLPIDLTAANRPGALVEVHVAVERDVNVILLVQRREVLHVGVAFSIIARRLAVIVERRRPGRVMMIDEL